eukprot:PhM_4_TR9590/c3_g1_i1/m.6621/K10877/RAD54B; DNA repair and recombination protein RAD54B
MPILRRSALSVSCSPNNNNNNNNGSSPSPGFRVPSFRAPTQSTSSPAASTTPQKTTPSSSAKRTKAFASPATAAAASDDRRYPPAKGRTDDQIVAERMAARQVFYPEPKSTTSSNKSSKSPSVAKDTSSAQTPVKQSVPPPEASTDNSLLSPTSTTNASPGQASPPPAIPDPTSTEEAEDGADVIPRLPLSVHSRLYFEVEIETTTKHASSGVLIVATEPDFGLQMFDRDGRQFGKPGSWYSIGPKEVAELKAPMRMTVCGKHIQLRTAVREEEFRGGSFFLDSQRKAKERHQKQLQAAQTALKEAQPKKKSILLSSLPGMRSRVGLRAGGGFVVPFKGVKRERTTATGGKVELSPLHDPDAEKAVVLFRASYKTDTQSRPIVSVVVDPVVGDKLRPHQVQGVQFLYDCVTGKRVEDFHGCILADEMGLGKSIQAVTLIWTCLRQGMYGQPITRRAMVVAPCSLVENWRKEFTKWIGEGVVKVCAIAESTPKGERILSRFESEADVLIISYDQLRKYVDRISSMRQVDLVVCDEGHKLKNAEIKTTKAVFQVPTKRRVILSGTPIQNDLTEFHAMVTFVNPGILGPLDVFCRVYQEPILRGREPKCEEEEKLLGQDRAHFLSSLTGKFILRRTQTLNEKYLPAKVEMTIFCKLTRPQEELYVDIVNSRGGELSNQPFAAITALRQLSSHMTLVDTTDGSKEAKEFLSDGLKKKLRKAPASERSSKLNLLVEVVVQCAAEKDKIVVVSNFTATLNLIAEALKAVRVEYFQLDGTTPIKKRQQFVDQFNAVTSREIVFLLSSKAGGVGLNLVGANRLILFDPDWNPANDAQAMGRVWRDGQKKRVYIYRFLCTGTIEEKIYMRQVSKQGLSSNVVDANQDSKQHFTVEDLQKLFVYNDKTVCETHELLNCRSCVYAQEQQRAAAAAAAAASSSSSNGGKDQRRVMKFKPMDCTERKGPRMDELKAWNHMRPGDLVALDELMSRAVTKVGVVSFAFGISRDPETISGLGVETEAQFKSDRADITVDGEQDDDDVEFEITQNGDDDGDDSDESE